MNSLPLVHVAATWFMTGVIWFVQVVHYPLMARVGSDGFAAYERSHTRLTTWIVGPAMLVEAGTGLALAVGATHGIPSGQTWVNVALISTIWISTALLQVPQHRVLERGFDAGAHAALVRTNWIRTAVWSARAVLVGTWI